jgi:hypothetical protein
MDRLPQPHPVQGVGSRPTVALLPGVRAGYRRKKPRSTARAIIALA